MLHPEVSFREDNPYRPPVTIADDPGCPRGIAWFLLLVWLVEGSVKLFFVIGMLNNDPRILGDILIREYQSAGPLWFGAGATYFTAETIGPVFGVYYLIRLLRGREEWEIVFWKILRKAMFWSCVIVLTTIIAVKLAVMS